MQSVLNLILLSCLLAGFTTAQQWVPGHSTHYGPFPSDPTQNEAGYRDLEVGVGCSTGTSDPEWSEILSHGVWNSTLDPGVVWPQVATVAVSQYIYSPIRNQVCWQKIQIRNANNHSATVEARVVDWCPTNGCNWSPSQRAFNVDIYGEKTWYALGGSKSGGSLNIEIQWPNGVDPYKLSAQAGDSGGLSTGAKAGVGVAVVICLGALGLGVWFGVRKWQEKRLLGRYSTDLPSMGQGHRMYT
ncbi:hypothetical protein HDV00_005050 [Rhizophlyctis rosea]|nr:hypothetical protein HDV00_005050 [Rhizophlyctis rosea]